MHSMDLTLELPADVISEATRWRHHLHKHPELAYQERGTSDFIAGQLARFGLKVHQGMAGTGVVGTLSRGTSRRRLGIRADMDALPIQEQSGVSHASCVAGVMHACGHDGHVSMALAAARLCTQLPDIDGTVHFIFQPAEENEAGARRMVEEGLFEKFPCDAVYALHNWPALPLGTCVARDGAMMAALGWFEIEIVGRGCHGAMPEEGNDPIIAGCHLVASLQCIVSRSIDPAESAVVSVGQFQAGEVWNAIPESCFIRGTTRWFKEDVGDVIEQRIKELSESITKAFGCQVNIRYERRIPATINDPVAASLVRTVIASTPGLVLAEQRPSMGAEDFAFMLGSVPGCYLWLGAGGANYHGLHSPRYDFNDDLLPLGARLWVSLIRQSLMSC